MINPDENFYLDIAITKSQVDDDTIVDDGVVLQGLTFFETFNFNSQEDLADYNWSLYLNGIPFLEKMTAQQIERRNHRRESSGTQEDVWELEAPASGKVYPTVKFSEYMRDNFFQELAVYEEASPGDTIATMRFLVTAKGGQELDLVQGRPISPPALEKQLDQMATVDKNLRRDLAETRTTFERLSADPPSDFLYEGRVWFNTTAQTLRVSVLEAVKDASPARNAWVVEDLFHGDASILTEHIGPLAVNTGNVNNGAITWPKLSSDVQDRFDVVSQSDPAAPSPADLVSVGSERGYLINHATHYYRVVRGVANAVGAYDTNIFLPYQNLRPGQILLIRNATPPMSEPGPLESQTLSIVTPSVDGTFTTTVPLFEDVPDGSDKAGVKLAYKETLYLYYTGESETFTQAVSRNNPNPAPHSYPKWRVLGSSASDEPPTTTFDALTDTPQAKVASQFVRANAGATALEYAQVNAHTVLKEQFFKTAGTFKIDTDTTYVEVSLETGSIRLALPGGVDSNGNVIQPPVGHRLLIKNVGAVNSSNVLVTGTVNFEMRGYRVVSGRNVEVDVDFALWHPLHQSRTNFALGLDENLELIRTEGEYVSTFGGVTGQYPRWRDISSITPALDIPDKSIAVGKETSGSESAGRIKEADGSGGVRWADQSSSETATTIKTKLETLSGTNRLAASAVKDLPTGYAGTWRSQTGSIPIGTMVDHNSRLYVARRTHNKQVSGPDSDATNWYLITEFNGTWNTSRFYSQGSFVILSGNIYVALQDVTASDPAPNATTNTKWANITTTAGSTETGATIKAKLEGLSGSARLLATAIQGRLEGVVAGTGLSGGGRSGSVTLGVSDGGIGNSQLASNAVGATSKIGDGVITEPKLSSTLRALIAGGTTGGSLQGRYVASTTLTVGDNTASISNWTLESGAKQRPDYTPPIEVAQTTKLFLKTARPADEQGRLGYLFKLTRTNPGHNTTDTEAIWIPGEDAKLALGMKVVRTVGGNTQDIDSYVTLDVSNTTVDDGIYSTITVDSTPVSQDTAWTQTYTAKLDVYAMVFRGEKGEKGDDGEFEAQTVNISGADLRLNKANWDTYKNKFVILNDQRSNKSVPFQIYWHGKGASEKNGAVDGEFITFFATSGTDISFWVQDASGAFRQLTSILQTATGTDPNKLYTNVVKGGQFSIVADSNTGLTQAGASPNHTYAWNAGAGDSNILGFSVERTVGETLATADYRDASITSNKLATDVDASKLRLGKSYSGNIPSTATDIQDALDAFDSFKPTQNVTVNASSQEGRVLPPALGQGAQLRNNVSSLDVTQAVFNEKFLFIRQTATSSSVAGTISIGDVGKLGERLYIRAVCTATGNSVNANIRLAAKSGWTIQHKTSASISKTATATSFLMASTSSNNKEEKAVQDFTLTRVKNPVGTVGETGYQAGVWSLDEGSFNAAEIEDIGLGVPPPFGTIFGFDQEGDGVDTEEFLGNWFSRELINAFRAKAHITSSISTREVANVNFTLSQTQFDRINVGDFIVIQATASISANVATKGYTALAEVRLIKSDDATYNVEGIIRNYVSGDTNSRIITLAQAQVSTNASHPSVREQFIYTLIKRSSNTLGIYPEYTPRGLISRQDAIPPEIPDTTTNISSTSSGSTALTKANFDSKYISADILASSGTNNYAFSLTNAVFNSLGIGDKLYLNVRARVAAATSARAVNVTFARPTSPTYIMKKQSGGQLATLATTLNPDQPARIVSIERASSFTIADHKDATITLVKTRTNELTVLDGRSDAFEGGTQVTGDTNVQSDWNVTDTSSDAFIKNKPTIPRDLSQLRVDVSSAKETLSGITGNSLAINSTRWNAWKGRTIYLDYSTTTAQNINLVFNGVPRYSPTAAHLGESIRFIVSRLINIQKIYAPNQADNDLVEVSNSFVRGSRAIIAVADQRDRNHVRFYADGLDTAPESAITDRSITGIKIAQRTIQNDNLGFSIINQNNMGINAVGTVELIDGQTTEAKLSTAYRNKIKDALGSTSIGRFTTAQFAQRTFVSAQQNTESRDTARTPLTLQRCALIHSTLGTTPKYNHVFITQDTGSGIYNACLPHPGFLSGANESKPMELTVLNRSSNNLNLYVLGQVVPQSTIYQVDSNNNVITLTGGMAHDIIYTLNNDSTSLSNFPRLRSGGAISLGAGSWAKFMFTGVFNENRTTFILGRDQTNNQDRSVQATALLPLWVLLDRKGGAVT